MKAGHAEDEGSKGRKRRPNGMPEEVVGSGKPGNDEQIGEKASAWSITVACNEKEKPGKSQAPNARIRCLNLTLGCRLSSAFDPGTKGKGHKRKTPVLFAHKRLTCTLPERFASLIQRGESGNSMIQSGD